MAELVVARRIRRRYLEKINWRLRDPQNPFKFPEREFIQRFRLNKIATTELINELRPFVSHGNNGYSKELYILSTLSVLGSGSFQHVTSDTIFSQISQPTLSRGISKVCDARMKILDIIAGWPGSTHDARIWRLSCLKHAMNSGIIPNNNFLLGDNGYPLEPWLLTPYLDPVSPREEIFNKKYRTARNIIERCFGVLKSRFRILDNSGGILSYALEKVCQIIMGRAVLHNMCIRHKIEEPELVAMEDECGDISPDENSGFTNDARVLRDRIAFHFQSRR